LTGAIGSTAAALAAAPAGAAELAGRIELVTPAGKPAGRAAAGNAVVYFEPARAPAALAPGTFEVVTRDKEFAPRVLAVPRGSTVRFPNADPILHNVFSVSGGNAFDLGLSGRGPGKAATFRESGVVRVFCNVHQAMVAYVVVVDTPHVVLPDGTGAFRLRDLPEGEGRLTAWHEQSEPQTVAVRVPSAAPVAVRLAVTRPKVPPHLNKFGRSYGRSRDRYQR
jgi:plastocyanin